ncbi:MAG: glycosyltransferase family 2 protein [Chloroflexi bacterium]|nr:glycosyltransferase family 2 protein [Chloroflexota bacterium]
MIDGMISLILPAHNEEPNIGPVVEAASGVLPEVFRDYEVIIVDDGSHDSTPRIADEVAAGNPHVKVVHHPHNRGYGAALTSGFRAASGDYWMFMDSDRQFDIRDVSRLAPYVSRYDIVAGYRMKRNDPHHRFIIGSTFNRVVRILFGIKVKDIDCGFKIFRADVLRNMDLKSPGALINTEIHAKAISQRRSLFEVGVNHYPRLEGEQSGASLKVVSRAMTETIKLWWRMRNYVPPNQPGAGRERGGLSLFRAGALLAASAAGFAVMRKMLHRGK